MLGHLFSVIVALSIKSGWPKPLGNVAFCHKVPTIKGKVKCGSQGKSSTLLIIGALIFYVFICTYLFGSWPKNKLIWILISPTCVRNRCLPRPKLCLGERYCFTRVSLWFCLRFCLLFRDQYNSKSAWTILIQFCGMFGF